MLFLKDAKKLWSFRCSLKGRQKEESKEKESPYPIDQYLQFNSCVPDIMIVILVCFICIYSYTAAAYQGTSGVVGVERRRAVMRVLMARKGEGKVDDMKEAMKYLESTQKKKKISATTKSMSPSHRGGGVKGGSRPSKGGGGQLSASDARMMRETIATDTSSSLPSAPQKVFGQQTIWGQNIINCRSFSLEARRVFEYTGSFVSVNAVPIYPLPEIVENIHTYSRLLYSH